jgi:hypothetical protein
VRRKLNILALVLFVAGFLAAPLLHGAGASRCDHGYDHSSRNDDPQPPTHDTEHCPICQLANTPHIAALPCIRLAPLAVAVAPLLIPSQAPVVRLTHRLPFSCGPPA